MRRFAGAPGGSRRSPGRRDPAVADGTVCAVREGQAPAAGGGGVPAYRGGRGLPGVPPGGAVGFPGRWAMEDEYLRVGATHRCACDCGRIGGFHSPYARQSDHVMA